MTSFEQFQEIRIFPELSNRLTNLISGSVQDKQDKQTQSLKNPICFYHKQNEINYFCKNYNCTLPLCDKCLAVHRVQHLNRKQIPMENILLFRQARKDILQKLIQSKQDVKSNHHKFNIELKKYRQRIIQIVDSTLNKLKQQLLEKDKQNSILKLQELNNTIQRIQNENSLKDIINSYQMFYQKDNKLKASQQDDNLKIKNRQNSVIDAIKLVPDQKNLIQTIQRGFLNCKFIRQPQIQSPKKSINRQLYLNLENITPRQKEQRQPERTPIANLAAFLNSNQSIKNNKDQLKPFTKIRVDNFIPQQNTIVQIKRQQRKSIFSKNQHQPLLKQKSIKKIFSNQNSQTLTKIPKQNQFSDVKKYKIQGQQEQQIVDVAFNRTQNIYTKNLNFQSFSNSNNTSREAPRVNKSISYISLGKSKGKGLSLTKRQDTQTDHYINKQKQIRSKFKYKLKTENNEFNRDQSDSRSVISDWKKVVNLSDSNVSFRNDFTSRQNSKDYAKQNYNKNATLPNKLALPNNNQSIYLGNRTNGLMYRNIQTDVLNPLQMRQLLIKKKAQKKISDNTLNFKMGLN